MRAAGVIFRLAIIILIFAVIWATYTKWQAGGFAANFPGFTGSVNSVTPSEIALGASQEKHQYWQIGVVADSSAINSTGMQTRIQTRLPSAVTAGTSEYFWIGSYLSDRSFIQIGYAIPWNQLRGEWFYCVFSSIGVKGPCVYGEPGSVGGTGKWNTFALTSAPIGNGRFLWTAELNGIRLGSFSMQTGSTGPNTPGVYGEQSSYTAASASDVFPEIEFFPAIQVISAGHSNRYSAPNHATVYYSAANVCPPYGLAVVQPNNVYIGSHLSCAQPYQYVW